MARTGFVVWAQTGFAMAEKWGPFESRAMAEKCLVALAGRPDVKAARLTAWDEETKSWEDCHPEEKQ